LERESLFYLQPLEVIRGGELPLLCWPLCTEIARDKSKITQQFV